MNTNLLKLQTDIRDAYKILIKQGPPGPPPRPGLEWNSQTHRWIRPGDSGQGSSVSMGGKLFEELHQGAAAIPNPAKRQRFQAAVSGASEQVAAATQAANEGNAQEAIGALTEANRQLVPHLQDFSRVPAGAQLSPKLQQVVSAVQTVVSRNRSAINQLRQGR